MKHAFTDSTLIESERLPAFAVLADASFEPVAQPSRCACLWVGARWAEIDPATRRVVERGRIS